MKAVVMAGGEGSRLRPLTLGRPKPMVPIVSRPVTEHILLLLKKHGITEVILTLQYMADSIQSYFGDGSRLGMHIEYSIEDVPMGTAGSVKLAQHLLTDTFIIISGDAMTDIDLDAIVAYHKANRSMATITLARVPNPLEYGVVITTPDGKIRQFLEKPSWSEVFSDTINTGIYVLEPQVMDLAPANQPSDFSQDIFPKLLHNGDPLYGFITDGYWCDVGNVSEYMRATRDVLERKVQVQPWSEQRSPDLWVGENVDIATDAELTGPIYIGNNVKIGSGVVIHGPTVISDNCTIEESARIDRSIVWRSSYVGERAELHGAIVCQQCTVRSNAILFEGTVLGDQTTVEEGALIRANVKVWPNKHVEAGATVASSIIWGQSGRRILFGRQGVSGLANIDFTPEFAAKLGAAYGATLPLGSSVAINRDLHRPSRMLKRAVISGLPSAGVNVLDLEMVPVPVARHYTRTAAVAGGIHVQVSPYNMQEINVHMFDKNGLDMDKSAERKIENLFFREDFRRARLEDIGTIDYARDALARYHADYFKSLDVKRIRDAGARLVVDFMQGSTTAILPDILESLECRVIAINSSQAIRTTSETSEAAIEEELRQMASITQSLPTDLGVAITTEGDRISLADGQGRLMPGMTALVAMTALALRVHKGGIVAVPVTAPGVIEQVAETYGGSVMRTKADSHALMQAASKDGVVLAGDGLGGFIFPRFQPFFDGMMAIAKLLEMLMLCNTNLADVMNSLPAFYQSTRDVACAWEQKARVMRELNESFRERRGRPIDGIKIELGDEWVLVLPDADRPLLHVIAEGRSQEEASDLANKYASVVSNLQR